MSFVRHRQKNQKTFFKRNDKRHILLLPRKFIQNPKRRACFYLAFAETFIKFSRTKNLRGEPRRIHGFFYTHATSMYSSALPDVLLGPTYSYNWNFLFSPNLELWWNIVGGKKNLGLLWWNWLDLVESAWLDEIVPSEMIGWWLRCSLFCVVPGSKGTQGVAVKNSKETPLATTE